MISFDVNHYLPIVAALPDPAFVIGKQNTILAANENAVDFFETNLVGKQLTEVLRTPAILQAVNEAIANEKSARVQQFVRTPVNRSYDIHVAPLGPGGALVILRDQTYEEQIERMRSDFVANASHELRTPLASLSGFIETMQGAAKNDAKAKDEFLKMMKAQADRMAQLIDDLLSLSRIEISEHVPPTEITDLAQIVAQACNLLADVTANSKCKLKLELPEPFLVIGDRNQLSQVVYNLIENALKYASGGKAVDIIGRVENSVAILAVRDYGQGIASHHVPRLTERFYRVSVQDSRDRGGTGLGLAIAKHIINRHRGKLVIQSEVGKGSTFSMHLPVAK